MALEVIGAGLGRNATFTLKFALEHLGFGPCYHMVEVFAGARRNVPLWLSVVDGQPDWDTIFDGYRSVTDHPACNYWQELAGHYPKAKVVLTMRDPDSWFDSVSETIYAPRMLASLAGSPIKRMFMGTFLKPYGDRIGDRAWMTEWYRQRNQHVIDSLPPERLLVFHPKEGWGPLCEFLQVPIPSEPFPRVNSRDELGGASDEHGGLPADFAELEDFAKAYLAFMQASAFPAS
jgi:hypothetical protein